MLNDIKRMPKSINNKDQVESNRNMSNVENTDGIKGYLAY